MDSNRNIITISVHTITYERYQQLRWRHSMVDAAKEDVVDIIAFIIAFMGVT